MVEQPSTAATPPAPESAPPPSSPVAPAARLEGLIALQEGDLARRLAEKRAAGEEVINLSFVEPELPPPPHAEEHLRTFAGVHAIRGAAGVPEFRSAAARWYHTRFKISVDPNRELLPLPSVEDGVLGLVQALLNPDDVVLVPDPARPIYRLAVAGVGAKAVTLPLRPEEDFLPELKAVPAEIAASARLLLLDYPNTPTGAVAPASFFHQVVQFAHEHQILVLHVASFSEFSYDGYRSISLLEIPGSRQVCVELHAPSLTYSLAGWPGAVAVGNADAVRLLRQFRQQCHALSFVPAQRALAEVVLQVGPEWIVQRNQIYQHRRDRAVAALERLGFHVRRPRAIPAVWAASPAGYTAQEAADLLLDEASVLLEPGSRYGQRGEGYVRMSLTVEEARFAEALRRLEHVTIPSRDMASAAEEGEEGPEEAPRPTGEETDNAS